MMKGKLTLSLNLKTKSMIIITIYRKRVIMTKSVAFNGNLIVLCDEIGSTGSLLYKKPIKILFLVVQPYK